MILCMQRVWVDIATVSLGMGLKALAVAAAAGNNCCAVRMKLAADKLPKADAMDDRRVTTLLFVMSKIGDRSFCNSSSCSDTSCAQLLSSSAEIRCIVVLFFTVYSCFCATGGRHSNIVNATPSSSKIPRIRKTSEVLHCCCCHHNAGLCRRFLEGHCIFSTYELERGGLKEAKERTGRYCRAEEAIRRIRTLTRPATW